ncbi:Cof-type HAD-IIB family hydrolase [Virgibacillus dakarensis]|uniref:Phosphatase YkrA n=1 Tax=Lentibacillus populi TaxID=1827502 RepID=A0A9W5TV32_9BACI|nr:MULTISPECIES: HAD family hydrolase [Bacillaceae]MBT2216774.1 Cof-type HAD-IIB family hydrolase [Virgibacillus dakarensis]MTW84328.1 Cof-type HAD-IIB family hydrolase [Virgibacillus dakarensis]GGB32518.1 putative phosphatase YkrA [Lentibacillus populi]
MPYNVLFLDIDGTILKPDHTYSPSTKDAIAQLKEKGIEVFLATGRPIHEIAELAEELGVNSFIGYNGAHAIYQNESIINEPLDTNTVTEFLKVAESNRNELVLYTNEKNYFTTFETPEVQQFIEKFQMKENEAFSLDIVDHVLGGTVINMQPAEVPLYEIEADIHLSQVNIEGVKHCYDIIRKAVNKGEAIKQVLKRLNIPAENAIAFGDGMNDKEMLQVAGVGFAMGNASPELFKYANRRTTSVEESGIFNGLKELGLVK